MASDDWDEMEIDDDQIHNPDHDHDPSQSTIASPVKFDVPDEYRSFTPFLRLPPEIRHQVWENTVLTPGMHFLKLAPVGPLSTSIWWRRETSSLRPRLEYDSKAVDEIAYETKKESRPKRVYHASLKPLYPRPEADVSYYTSVCKQLAKLSVTCNEAASVANSLTMRANTLRIGTGLVSLDCSADVIYLEYIPPDVFEHGCSFAKTLNCPNLEKIHNVAVRYCHKWYEHKSPTICPECGQFHNYFPDKPNYPRHLYRFMAQYLPNLKSLYFIDYFILRKQADQQNSPEASTGSSQAPGKSSGIKFQGGNRVYHQVDSENWNITSKVFQVQSWLQKRFVEYAKTSKLSKHDNPERVKFGVLACEWGVIQPGSVNSTPRSPIKKGVNKRTRGEDSAPRRRQRPTRRSSPAVNNQAQAQAPVETNGGSLAFGTEATEGIQFTFRASLD